MRQSVVARLAARDLARHGRRLVLGSVGLVVATAVVSFGLGLASGLRHSVLERVFPLDVLEVTPKAVELDLFAVRLGLGASGLTAKQVAEAGELPGVEAMSPRLVAAVPATLTGGGGLLGANLTTELAVDGLEAAVLEDDLEDAGFGDPGDGSGRPCASDRDCSRGEWCGRPWAGGPTECRAEVPVVASHHLVELYNTSLRRSWGLPQLNPDAVVGLVADLDLGRSSLGLGSAARGIRERVRLVGFSDRAIPLGVTLPLARVERINRFFGRSDQPHAAMLVLEEATAAPRAIAAAEAAGLEIRDRGARRAAAVLGMVEVAVIVVGVLLGLVSALGVGHAMALVVSSRRQELAVLRAVGLSRREVVAALAIEVVIVAVAAAAVGLGLAVAAGRGLDQAVHSLLPALPYVPDQLVSVTGGLALVVAGAAAVIAVIGATPPIARAVSGDPDAALRRR